MTDIVKRLREPAGWECGLYDEAADEIERLRAMNCIYGNADCPHCQDSYNAMIDKIRRTNDKGEITERARGASSSDGFSHDSAAPSDAGMDK